MKDNERQCKTMQDGRTIFAGLASASRTSAVGIFRFWTFAGWTSAGRTSAGLRHLPVGHLPVGTLAGRGKSNHGLIMFNVS